MSNPPPDRRPSNTSHGTVLVAQKNLDDALERAVTSKEDSVGPRRHSSSLSKHTSHRVIHPNSHGANAMRRTPTSSMGDVR
jgi:hypothetical protein